jgi:hypothetical protein
VLTILRFILRTQEVDFLNGDSLDERNIEGMGDKLTMMVQDLDEKIGRSVLLPPSSSVTGIELPIPAAGKLIRWKATLDGFENVAVADIGSQVINNFWAVVLAAAGSSLAEALATMGLAGSLETFALPANTTISAFIKTSWTTPTPPRPGRRSTPARAAYSSQGTRGRSGSSARTRPPPDGRSTQIMRLRPGIEGRLGQV